MTGDPGQEFAAFLDAQMGVEEAQPEPAPEPEPVRRMRPDRSQGSAGREDPSRILSADARMERRFNAALAEVLGDRATGDPWTTVGQ